MGHIIYPYRSVLYVPASNARALAKAQEVAADAVILDLEDAVAPSAKDLARQQLVALLRAPGAMGSKRCLVRVNGQDTPWGAADLASLAQLRCDGVVLPKVERPESVLQCREHLRPEQSLWLMIETPRGVQRVDDLCIAAPSIAGLILGSTDLAAALRARPGTARTPLLYAMQRIVCAARAAGIVAIDGIHRDLDDEEGLRIACEQGREMGFDGKSLIHPKSIAMANAVFSPSVEDCANAERVIAAVTAASEAGCGVAVVDGRLIEHMHVAEAERVLALAQAIALAHSPIPANCR